MLHHSPEKAGILENARKVVREREIELRGAILKLEWEAEWLSQHSSLSSLFRECVISSSSYAAD